MKKNRYKLNHFAVRQKLMQCCKSTIFQLKKKKIREFPGGPVVKNLPSNVGNGGSGFSPGRGTRVPHAAGQLSPHTTTTESTHLNY